MMNNPYEAPPALKPAPPPELRLATSASAIARDQCGLEWESIHVQFHQQLLGVKKGGR